MSEHIKKTIDEMQAKLREQEEAVASTKKLINQLCAYAGMPPIYLEGELQVSGGPSVCVKRNSFFGRPLTTCVKEFLEMRKRAGLDAASLDEIFGALQEGGYHLDEISSKSEAEQKRGVAISLGKNSSTFVRLASKDWGLLEWYPNVKKRKNGAKGNGGEGEGASDEPETAPADAEPGATTDVVVPADCEPAKAEETPG